MYIMLDRSASMLDEDASGLTRWDAIRQALIAFIDDPASSGLGVGLQYFPLGVAGVPDSCTTDADCGAAGGACTAKVCRPAAPGGSLSGCFSDADCPVASPGCVAFGVCSGDATLVCFDVRPGGCLDDGDCVPYEGECTKGTSCIADDYARAAVPIATLPDNAVALLHSLNAESPKGATPTPVALAGALTLASAQARQQIDRRVIVVLATDGLPTQCFPSTIQSASQAISYTAQVARRSLLAHPSILTYVIGVLAPDDPGSAANLKILAVAGGTKQAIIVDQQQDVSQQFLEALAKIRSGSLACEYKLPAAPANQTLDFNLINVEFTADDTTRDLLYVGSEDACGKTALGWYYDVDPSSGESPTKITVCTKTCDTLRAASEATLQIRLGCATLEPS
jgi:hypothetical protein